MRNYSEHMALHSPPGPLRLAPRLTPASSVPLLPLASVLCLCLTGASLAASAPDGDGNRTDYQRAVASFNRADYAGATALLDKIPESGISQERADVLNLRGAICLKQRRFEKARSFFSRAGILDPGLWAASFNEAEANFEEKNYAESRRQFFALLDKTPQAGHPEEWAVVQYKALLASLLGGNDKPVRAYVAAHAKDTPAPPSYYYLNAAVEYQQSHPREAAQWLDKAATNFTAGAQQMYAETFTEMGWPGPRLARGAGLAGGRGVLNDPAQRSNPVFAAMNGPGGGQQRFSPASLAVVQLIPGQSAAGKVPFQDSVAPEDRPSFRFNGPLSIPMPAPEPAVQNNPPVFADNLRTAPGQEGGMMVGAALPDAPLPEAALLARDRSSKSGKPKPGKATPTPSEAPSTPQASNSPPDSPAASASPAVAAGGASAQTPAPLPAEASSPAPALPAFVQKYEAAYVKFIQKDFTGAKGLLDEADAIQANQPSSISLRGQIFKHYYEAAYVDYLKADYPAAIGELNLADGVQTDQPDAANLRGLVFSRQHNYEQAENMFKKAIAADATFWAAKFNLAELPFNYRNYTSARSRFEVLFSQTDPVKQPREAELTQFKVFLTLLLEGKEAGARSFMEHFTFSGTTPARYFCQSALDFYHGDVTKAMTWLDSAKKEYPAQLVSIFVESFYRVGWMTDPAAARPETAAVASPSPAVVAANPSPGAVVAKASPALSAVAPATSPSPAILVAKASPASSAVATATPAASPAMVVAKTTPAPTPVASAASPANVARASPAPAIAAATATPAPAVVAKSTPAATVVAAATATPAPTSFPSPSISVTKAGPVPSATTPSFSPSPAIFETKSNPAHAVVAATPSPSPAIVVAKASSASPAPSAGAGTPAPSPAILVAKSTPTPSLATFNPTASPAILMAKASPAPTFAAAAPSPSPSISIAKASPVPSAATTPVPTPIASGVRTSPIPIASPLPSSLGTVSPYPTPKFALPMVVAPAASASPSTLATPAVKAPAPFALAASTPAETAEPVASENASPASAEGSETEESSPGGDLFRNLVVLFVLTQFLVGWSMFGLKYAAEMKRRKARRVNPSGGKPRPKTVGADKV